MKNLFVVVGVSFFYFSLFSDYYHVPAVLVIMEERAYKVGLWINFLVSVWTKSQFYHLSTIIVTLVSEERGLTEVKLNPCFLKIERQSINKSFNKLTNKW